MTSAGMSNGYSISIDDETRASWDETVRNFDDANIFQTWAYGEVRQGQANVSHAVLRRFGHPVAAAQLRLFKLSFPLFGGIAYLRWGPLWRVHDRRSDVEEFRQFVRALRDEYVVRRRMVLRILPRVHDQVDLTGIMQREGFRLAQGLENTRTLLLNLELSLDHLRRGLGATWRRHLNQASRTPLEIDSGENGELFDEFISLYDEMRERKKFVDGTNIRCFKEIQTRLPADSKFRIFICRSNDRPCAGAIISAMGITALYLCGASNELGRQTMASFLMHWKIVEWLKAAGFRQYDLNGISPTQNPGTYQFKAGLCGKGNGDDVTLLGPYQAAGSLTTSAITVAERFRQSWRSRRSAFRRGISPPTGTAAKTS